MKKLTLRFVLCFVLAFALLGIWVNNDTSFVQADSNPINVQTSFSYNCIDVAHYISLFENVSDSRQNDVNTIDRNYIASNGVVSVESIKLLIDDALYGINDDYVLVPGVYYVSYSWTSVGSFVGGTQNNVEFTVTPKLLTHTIYTKDLQNSFYASSKDWTINNLSLDDVCTNPDTQKQDDCRIQWLYISDENQYPLNDTTEITIFFQHLQVMTLIIIL